MNDVAAVSFGISEPMAWLLVALVLVLAGIGIWKIVALLFSVISG